MNHVLNFWKGIAKSRTVTSLVLTVSTVGVVLTTLSVSSAQQVKRQGAPDKKPEQRLSTVEEAYPSPLTQAIVNQQIPLIYFLLSKGADPNGEDKTPQSGIPILVAASVGDVEILRVLLNAGARINSKDDSGLTALMITTLRGDTKTVAYLLQKGASVNAQSDKGATALMTAARDEQVEIIKLLLKAKADVNLAADGGVTALMAAGDSLETVKALLAAGAKADLADLHGWTAVCYAKANKQLEKLATLLRTAPHRSRECQPR